MILRLLVLPLASAAAAFVLPRRAALWANALASIATLGAAGALAVGVLGRGEAPSALGGHLVADPLGVVFAIVVAAAGAVAALVGARTFDSDPDLRPHARRYAVLAPALLAALLATVLADHLGVLWITMELSAVLGAFLVGFHGQRPELEAAFKYMILGSAGLVIGLLATAFVHKAGVAVLGSDEGSLSFATLAALGARLDPETMRLALALAVAGYGLKVGLFPLHVWKPDAYAAAPAPVTAVLAGAAVAVPLVAIARFGALASAAGEGAFAGRLFVAVGLVSMVGAAILAIRERDMRRILAFTSVEHMGLVLVALGLGPAVVRGGLLHLLANGTLKALAFGLLGFAVEVRGTGDTQSGPGLAGRSAVLGGVFLVAIAAALGFPPFAMFASELAILSALFAGGHVALGLAVTVALATLFGVVATGAIRLVYGRVEAGAPGPGRHGIDALALGVPVLAAMAWVGLAIPASIWERLGDVAREISP